MKTTDAMKGEQETECLREEAAEAIARVRHTLAQIRELMGAPLEEHAETTAHLLEEESHYEKELLIYSRSRCPASSVGFAAAKPAR